MSKWVHRILSHQIDTITQLLHDYLEHSWDQRGFRGKRAYCANMVTWVQSISWTHNRRIPTSCKLLYGLQGYCMARMHVTHCLSHTQVCAGDVRRRFPCSIRTYGNKGWNGPPLLSWAAGLLHFRDTVVSLQSALPPDLQTQDENGSE